MKKYDIVITQPAEEDLQEIADYISKELMEPKLAQKLIARIGEAIIGLEDMPHRYAFVSDERLAAQGFRKIIIDNQIVFYVVAEKDYLITVVRILSGRRDWVNLI